MKWSPEAEHAIKRVPFFVKKKVRNRVEKIAAENGRRVVGLSDVKTAKDRFLNKMESEIKGYQVDTCFGTGGCPNRVMESADLADRIETLLKEEDLLGFLKQTVTGDLKFHHEFRITLSDCPNACSQPQIKDIGIIGANIPRITDKPCSLCEACVEECRENAISLREDGVDIDLERCVYCGRCMEVCPTLTIVSGEKGYRVQLGGKLGRHPRLAKELPGLYGEDEVVSLVKKSIQFYKENSQNGRRFGEILESSDFFDHLARPEPS